MTGLNLKLDEQRELREQVEKELRQSRQHGSSVLALESREGQSAKQSSERYGVFACKAVDLVGRSLRSILWRLLEIE